MVSSDDWIDSEVRRLPRALRVRLMEAWKAVEVASEAAGVVHSVTELLRFHRDGLPAMFLHRDVWPALRVHVAVLDMRLHDIKEYEPEDHVSEGVIAAGNALHGELKRGKLIRLYRGVWETIERDFRDSPTNGLAAAAKAARHGMWRVGAALEWARERGRLGRDPAAELQSALRSPPGPGR